MVLPEIRFLQAAIVLAEELHFSRAAERLGIEQSSLSKRIQELENQIGLRLFVRSRNRQSVELTEAGLRFVEEARIAIVHVERAIFNSTAASHGAEEILNIGKSAYVDPYLISTLLSIQLPLYPGLKVKLWSNYSHELAHMVTTGQLDLALITAIPDTPQLSFLTVAKSLIYIALPKEVVLARNKKLCLEDLRPYEWVLLAPYVNPHLFKMIQMLASEKGIVASDLHHVMIAEEASELVLAHKGVAFLPRDAAWRIACDSITIRPLAEEQLKLVTRLAVRSDNKTRLVSEFVRAAGHKLSRIHLLERERAPLAG